MALTYLDYNAYCPLDPELREYLVGDLYTDFSFGAHLQSNHKLGKRARDVRVQAEDVILESLGVPRSETSQYRIFTFSSGSAANKAVLNAFGLTAVHYGEEGPGYEHPSLFFDQKTHKQLSASDNPDSINYRIQAVANSESGLISHIQSAKNILNHRDAAAAWGKTPASFDWFMQGSALLVPYKLGFLGGLGILVVHKESVQDSAALDRLISCEASLVDPLPFALIARAGAEFIQKSVQIYNSYVRSLRDQFEDEIRRIQSRYPVEIVDSEPEKSRLPNTSLLCFKGALEDLRVMEQLSLSGVCVSNGPACQSMMSLGSHLLRHRGYSPWDSKNVVRVSFGKFSQPRDLEVILDCLEKIIKRWSG